MKQRDRFLVERSIAGRGDQARRDHRSGAIDGQGDRNGSAGGGVGRKALEPVDMSDQGSGRRCAARCRNRARDDPHRPQWRRQVNSHPADERRIASEFRRGCLRRGEYGARLSPGDLALKRAVRMQATRVPPHNRYGHLIEMAAGTLAASVDVEVLGRTSARISIPIATPFRRTHRVPRSASRSSTSR